MTGDPMSKLVSVELIQNKIYLIRGKRVMLDKNLAFLYGVQTFRLNEQVKRNRKRFPIDFCFQLTKTEFHNLISQNAISSWGGARKLPYAFTEQGVAMLSSVLNSQRAIEVNIRIMRVFTKLRETIISHKDLAERLSNVESKVNKNDKDIRLVFEAIRALMSNPDLKNDYKRTKIGFVIDQ